MTTPLWLERHLTMACTVYNRVPAGVDEYGNELYAEVGTDTLGFLQPASQEEIEDGRMEVGQYLLHLKASMAALIDGFARVEVAGVSYEAVAAPAVYPCLTGPGVHHVEIIVQKGSGDEV